MADIKEEINKTDYTNKINRKGIYKRKR